MTSKRFLRKQRKLSNVQAEEAVLAFAAPRTVVRRRRRYAVRRVVGESMYPTLQQGELVVAKRVKQLRSNDVIVFEHKGLEKIKRIREVEGNRLYVVGDNPLFSTDSRHYGMIFIEDVIGKVIWPRVRD